MIILMGIALTILCICSVLELALLLFFVYRCSKQALLKDKQSTAQGMSNLSAEPAEDANTETLKQARKRYEEELLAFQDLLNYNADVAYGVESLKEE